MHTLKISLPNYFNYHFRITIGIEVGALDSLDEVDNDRVEFWDGDTLLFKRNYDFKSVN